jgi:hypothetical protein
MITVIAARLWLIFLDDRNCDAVAVIFPRRFREMRRVLDPDGALLLAFHFGAETIHLDELWGQAVSLDFRFLMPGEIVASLETAGLVVTESTEREPYEGAEYPSRRCYLFARPGRS